MAAALLLLAGLLLPAGRLSPQFGSARKVNGVKCSHHAECRSDCCLVDLDSGGSSCAPKAKIRWACLPQQAPTHPARFSSSHLLREAFSKATPTPLANASIRA
ncbi:colipase-like protein 2 isoform X2 [Dasypus novemcinctus]|uniref:colipase-like protein 2 isoform X2 n=1 Tax=Dasypus novemcinctus TaxID=9361 RepID=UPI00265FF8D7|nr:colipase-like protein 2 isoform X2 [Dasypus novemcinctus]